MTTNEKVEYELGLKDNFSGPLKDAEKHAHGFHESVLHIVEALGLLELAHEGLEFFKESFEEYEKHEIVVASLTQMYKNNTDSVGMNVKELEELAEAQQKVTGIHSEEIMKAEQTLIKYKQIKISYEELIPVIDDFAKATGQDASEAANTLGRALENPERAARLLMQAGISPGQQEMYKTLSKTGDSAKAQGYLMDILGDKYKGVAAAMLDANIGAQLDIEVKEVKESIGELVTEFAHALMPTIKSVFEHIKEATKWIKEHKEGIEDVIKVLGILASGYLIYSGIQTIITNKELILDAIWIGRQVIMAALGVITLGYAGDLTILTEAQEYLNIAMDANPIGAIILAVTALTAALYELIQSYKEANAIMLGEGNKHKGLEMETASVEALADRYLKLGMSRKEAMSKAVDFEKNELFRQMQELSSELDKETDDVKRRGVMHQIQNVSGELSALSDKNKLVSNYASQLSGKNGVSDIPKKSESVKGQSHITINVAIGKMTGIEKLITQNLKEGIDKTSDGLLKMLLGTVDQFSASAEI